MGMVDAFSPEDRVNVKFSDFYRLVKQSTESEFMLNGIKQEVEHDSIYKIITGKALHEEICKDESRDKEVE